MHSLTALTSLIDDQKIIIQWKWNRIFVNSTKYLQINLSPVTGPLRAPPIHNRTIKNFIFNLIEFLCLHCFKLIATLRITSHEWEHFIIRMISMFWTKGQHIMSFQKLWSSKYITKTFHVKNTFAIIFQTASYLF